VKFLSAVVLLVIFSLFGELLAQEFYRWVDDKGIVHFADSLHSIPEKYRLQAEKRLLAPSSEMPTPAAPGAESTILQVTDWSSI
jgi:hypothetical protein